MASTPVVIGHWHQLLENIGTSSLDFYSAVEDAAKRREIPEFATSRVDMREGGIFSGRRTYLRVMRGDLSFDICAAPFGTGFFVSWWLAERMGCLMALPIIGPIIGLFRGGDTYYRQDTAFMFQESVSRSVFEVIDKLKSAKGLRALSEDERKPVLRPFLK